MLRTFATIVVFLMLCLPIGGGIQLLANGPAIPALPAVNANARCWFSPMQLALISGCVLVLALTAARRMH